MKADQINTANQTRLQLIDEAEKIINPLERKVRLGMGNANDTSKLREWEIYTRLT